MADAELMDSESVLAILADQERLATLRAPYESTFRDIDRFIDPFGSGGFLNSAPGNRDVEDLYDITAIDSLDRYTAAIGGIEIPRGQRWHGVEFDDQELMKLPVAKRWCQHATDRLFAARYASSTGFEAQSFEDIRQEGKYGSSGLWIGEKVGTGLFYKSLHLSELFFDENYYGCVDRVHRLYTTTILKASREFGEASLSDKSRADLGDNAKRNREIQILHVVRPNLQYEPGFLGAKGKPVESVYIEVQEKHPIRRKGFRSMPLLVSRHVTGPRDIYGRSPAMKVLAEVKGLQSMARTILDAGNRVVDPPLLYSDEGDITKIVTKPGGATAGGVNDQGQPLVHPLYTGAQLPIGLEMQQAGREIVKRAFLEEFFRLLSDPSDRMTATQVVEQLKKEGVLIGPFAGRRETEKIAPMVERELEIMMNAGAIAPLPPEALEAGAKPKIRMTNPLSKMARAEEISAFTRTVEVAVQAASAGATEALEVINFEEGVRDTHEILGGRPTHIYSPEEVAQRRADKQAAEQAAAVTQAIPDVAQGALNLAKANQIAEQLGQGGGV